VIAFEDVSVTVDTPAGPKTLLDSVTAELAERRIAVIGANGSGKSTLLRLINGLAEPSAGTVTVDGLATTGKTAAAVRRRVGFIFTDPMAQLLMPTACEDIELSLRHTVKSRATRRERATALMEEWGLGHLTHSSVYDLSGGERQLVALISVLAVGPQIVVADEPTTLLDRRNARRIHTVLGGLGQQLIAATHDLEWALDFERVLVVEGGRLVFDGPAGPAVDHYRALVDGAGPGADVPGPPEPVAPSPDPEATTRLAPRTG
jgi:biotin transport system ATP-binding protein